jgi:hypothetical protein
MMSSVIFAFVGFVFAAFSRVAVFAFFAVAFSIFAWAGSGMAHTCASVFTHLGFTRFARTKPPVISMRALSHAFAQAAPSSFCSALFRAQSSFVS